MLKLIQTWLNKKYPIAQPVVPPKRERYIPPLSDRQQTLDAALQRTFQIPARLLNQGANGDPKIAMDSGFPNYKPTMAVNQSQILTQSQINYYSEQSFIGYQFCAMLAQHWLISKCCLIPAQDAVRNGYEITSNDGSKLTPEMLDKIRQLDVEFNLNHNLVELIQMGRIFGIRVALFVVDMGDPDLQKEYYANPFNIDAVKPGSYRGISQIDPYWMTYQLDNESAGNPASIRFYEPTWWIIGELKIHYSHLVIFRTEEVTDILKPTYYYGGIPIPQKIANRVYAAERTANEAPMLALSKRAMVLKTDVTEATADWPAFNARMAVISELFNNWGQRIIGTDDEFDIKDTSLTDVDTTIMTQYQLVASAANVPSTKLLGTSPKGFDASGEYEEAVYHEELESVQAHGLTPLILRHHQLLIRSELNESFETCITWNSLDAMTAKEQGELNKLKSETDNNLVTAGAIDGNDIRDRLINDNDSGYTGLSGAAPEPEVDEVENDKTETEY